MLLAGRKAGLSLASFPIELRTIFLRNDTVHSGLHSIASINIEETPPPTDQFNLDNVSIKIQYSVKVMIKANQNIFYSVKNKNKDVSCSIRRGIQCGNGVEKNEEEEDGRKCIYLHLESTQETGIQFLLSYFVRLTPSKEGTVSKVPAWKMICLS